MGCAAQYLIARSLLQIADQRAYAVEARLCIAPEQLGLRRELMLLNRVNFFLGELRSRALCSRFFLAHAAQCAERAIALMAASAPSDLRHFSRGQPALSASIKLSQRAKGNMLQIKVEAHADRISGDDVIHLAILKQLDLLVARFGRKRPHHHCRPAPEPAQHFGHGVDLLGRECDYRTARGQARQFATACVGEGGEARALNQFSLWHQRFDHRLQRGGTQQHRFFAAARIEQPVSKDVSAFRIGGQLRFVQSNKSVGAILASAKPIHRLSRAEKIARIGRLNPFFASDQRNRSVTLNRADPVIHFARQQPQRKADHPAGMAAHPLNREMRLAGIGRAKNRLNGAGMAHNSAFCVPVKRPRSNACKGEMTKEITGEIFALTPFLAHMG